MAMTGGDLRAPLLTLAWPTGEFGPMSLEGAVRLGYRREFAALPDDAARQARFDELVAEAYRRGGALNVASAFEVDDVVDPADTREVLLAALRSADAAM
jgi:acetyl-CoA carboxylase carboxyltransferase component